MIAVVLAVLLVLVFIASSGLNATLCRVADAIEAQNKHYGIGPPDEKEPV